MFYIVGALAGMAIGIVLTLSVMEAGNHAADTALADIAIDQVAQIRSYVRESGFLGDYSYLSNAFLESAGSMPTMMIAGAIGSGNDVNPWGGVVTVTPYGVYGQCFAIGYQGLMSGDCEFMATHLLSTCALAAGAVEINGVWEGNLSMPLAPTAAAAACDLSGSANRILWAFSD